VTEAARLDQRWPQGEGLGFPTLERPDIDAEESGHLGLRPDRLAQFVVLTVIHDVHKKVTALRHGWQTNFACSRFPMLEEGDKGNPLGTGNCANQGDLKSNDLPNERSCSLDHETFQLADGHLQIVLGNWLIIHLF
jgi:hypothetical protein